MGIDPLRMIAEVRNYAKPSTSSSAQPASLDFEDMINDKLSQLNSLGKTDGDVAAVMQKLRINLMQGLLVSESDSEDDLFLSSGLEDLMIRTSAARSQMIDKYAAMEKYTLSQPLPSKRGEIDQIIDRVAEHVSLDSDLIHSVVRAESAYRSDAVSHAGAEGLMQLMPATAAELGVKNSFDPQQNLLGGSRYLKQLMEKYDGDLDHALAAYNWGQGNVDRHGLEKMPEETRTYISRVRQGLQKVST
jgi:Transglycosylase SLT domain